MSIFRVYRTWEENKNCLTVCFLFPKLYLSAAWMKSPDFRDHKKNFSSTSQCRSPERVTRQETVTLQVLLKIFLSYHCEALRAYALASYMSHKQLKRLEHFIPFVKYFTDFLLPLLRTQFWSLKWSKEKQIWNYPSHGYKTVSCTSSFFQHLEKKKENS